MKSFKCKSLTILKVMMLIEISMKYKTTYFNLKHIFECNLLFRDYDFLSNHTPPPSV